MRKAYKILSALMLTLMLVCICTNVFAFSINNVASNKVLNGVDDKMTSIGSTILTIVTNAAMIIAVVVIAVLGVKYMMGSTEEKAEYKKTMIPYLVGAILVFGASAIGKAVIEMGKSFTA